MGGKLGIERTHHLQERYATLLGYPPAILKFRCKYLTSVTRDTLRTHRAEACLHFNHFAGEFPPTHRLYADADR